MTRQNNTSSRIIPVSWLLPSIGVCLVGAALCVPGKVELLQRLQADGNKSSVEEMAAEARKNKGVEDMTQATDRQKLRHWLTNPDNSVRTDPAIQLDTINMCAASLSPGELADEVLAHGDAIPQELWDKLLAGMASGVIGRGGVPNIAAGADIYTRWCRLAPSWALATQAAEAWMWAGKPAGASAVMEFMASREPGLEGAPGEPHGT